MTQLVIAVYGSYSSNLTASCTFRLFIKLCVENHKTANITQTLFAAQTCSECKNNKNFFFHYQ